MYQKIGLALGGGGTRGVAHLGVLKHLEDLELKPDYLSGTSAGAIVAVLYSFGVSIDEIFKTIQKLKATKISSLRVNQLGLFENTDLLNLLEEKLPKEAKLENAPIPLIIQATNIYTGEIVYLKKGSAIEAVMASSCVPGIYLPQKINGEYLVDGGLSENVPLSSLNLLGANIKIAVNLNGNKKYRKPQSLIDILSNSLDIAIDSQTRAQLQAADIAISMDLTQYSRFQLNHDDAEELFQIGLKSTQQVLKGAKNLMMKHQFNRLKNQIKQFTPLKIPAVLSRIMK